jgi:hypothetical protein
MKLVNGIAYATTQKERLALKILKYDLFNNESKYPDWNAGRLGIEDAFQYMEAMYKDFYSNSKDIINPEFEVYPYDLETGEKTIAVSYYREPNQFEQAQRIIDGKEVVYSTDVIGALIPSNYEAIVAGYKLRGKYRKAAMLKRKYDKKLGVA